MARRKQPTPEEQAIPSEAAATKRAAPRPSAKRAPAPKASAATKATSRRARLAAKVPEAGVTLEGGQVATTSSEIIRVRRMHRRDINRVWEFLKRVFRDVNQKTVEYQRPRSKQRFEESYDDEGIEQLIFEVGGDIVGYAESTFQTTGSDNWINWRFFDSRDMRPLFVEELAVHPDYQGRGVGGFMLEQLQHIARLRGCTHLVLEVAENNKGALSFYRKRNFFQIDAAIFLAKKIEHAPELLPPRPIKPQRGEE